MSATHSQPARPVEADGEPELPPHFRRNYLAHMADGWLIRGGMAFISTSTVLPTIVKSLGGTVWLISLVPVVAGAGGLLSPLLTAHHFDVRRRYKPVVNVAGVLLRLPYALPAAALLLLAARWPRVALAAVLLAPLLSGTAWGLARNAWWQLVAHTVPGRRRASLMAGRALGGGVIALGAGWSVRRILEAYPGTNGYGLLYLLGSVMMFLSYGAYLLVRERPHEVPPEQEHRTLLGNLRSLPGMVARDRMLVFFLAPILLMNAMILLLPFLPLHAVHVLDARESYVGELLIFQTLGMLGGNLLLGYLGDRFGGKLLMVLAGGVFLAVCGAAALARSTAAFRAVFVLLGVSSYGWLLGTQVLSLELAPRGRRSSFLAATAGVRFLGVLAAYAVSASLPSHETGMGLRGVLAGAATLVSVILLLGVEEPRNALRRVAAQRDLPGA